MKCYYHPDRDAVSQCVECGKGLCLECADKFNPPHCTECANVIVEDSIKTAKKQMRSIKLLGIIGFIYPFCIGVIFFLAAIIKSNFFGGIGSALLCALLSIISAYIT